MINRIAIRNYRLFRTFDLALRSGMNVLVGNNDSGKSTLLEAINLALTGRVGGRFLQQEISPYFVNQVATREYVQALLDGNPLAPPEIIVDLFLDANDDTEPLRGTNNVYGDDACGVRIHAKLSQEYSEEYQRFISTPDAIQLVPTEYYRVEWLGFSGNGVTARSVPAAASIIDPTSIRLQSGADYHLQQIINSHLEPAERVELSRQYRSLREQFGGQEAIQVINQRLRGGNERLTDRNFSLSIDISQRYTWEGSLVAHLDDLPFQFIGKGEQNSLKTMLAISRRAERAHVVLVEEPENHLSFTGLRRLVERILQQCQDKQVIVTTHSAYVLNKLGLEGLALLSPPEVARFTDLPADTISYFKRLAGFDTLRLVLAEAAMLVEGPSDELIVQRAYLDRYGHLPIDDGIDVITVGLSHKRFLDLAVRLGRRVWIITDNDGKSVEEMQQRFADYLGHDSVSLHTGSNPALRTLEPNLVAVNELAVLNAALQREFATREAAEEYMLANKTEVALNIFESDAQIVMPEYIRDAVG